jgi:hypothetical protein
VQDHACLHQCMASPHSLPPSLGQRTRLTLLPHALLHAQLIPRTLGKLKKGNYLLTNWNGADGNAGRGHSIVQMDQLGRTEIFATIPNNPPPAGCNGTLGNGGTPITQVRNITGGAGAQCGRHGRLDRGVAAPPGSPAHAAPAQRSASVQPAQQKRTPSVTCILPATVRRCCASFLDLAHPSGHLPLCPAGWTDHGTGCPAKRMVSCPCRLGVLTC